MSQVLEKEIVEAEEQLREAMLNSSVDELERLLATDLLFTNHLGQMSTKEQDISAHASGSVKIDNLELSDLQIRVLGGTAVVAVQVQIAGTFMGSPASGTFRFTRVWKKNGNGWQVAAGHSCVVV